MSDRVLLVEDDPQVMEFAKMMLEQERYHVLTAEDGEAALKVARSEKPDIILLDVLLPKIHGYEVCDRLRQDPNTCLIPIIMVTALTSLKDRVTGLKLGADEYVSKPYEPVELLARIDRLLQRTRHNVAANPLTGLSVGVTLEQAVRHRLEKKREFSIGLCDLNYFRDFNKESGYEAGDRMIRLVATILRSTLAELGNLDDVVVHFGGDDFGFLTTTERGGVITAKLLETADALIPLHYDEKVRERYFQEQEEKGEKAQCSFLTLRVGRANLGADECRHPAEAIDKARRALREAKENKVNLVTLA